MTADIVNINDFPKKYKTDQGVFRLRGLFFEETLADKSTVMYTLKDIDHAGYPSLRRLYLEICDPTEYFFACKYMDGWAHWERLLDCEWFQPYILRWRREMEMMIRARALIHIMMISQNDGKESFNANKYLLSGSWKIHNSDKISKEEVKSLADVTAKQVAQDAKRLEDVIRTTP